MSNTRLGVLEARVEGDAAHLVTGKGAFVVVQPLDDGLRVSVVLDRSLESEGFRVTKASENRFYNEIEIKSLSELWAVSGWLLEASELQQDPPVTPCRRFIIRSKEVPSTKDPTSGWKYSLMQIYDQDQGGRKVGEYLRNYSEGPFFSFKNSQGKWYALYSYEYDRTCVMNLPNCTKVAQCDSDRREDVEGDTSGFCPVEFWVPYRIREGADLDNLQDSDWHHLDFGFVYGCYWGEPEWPIRLLNLSLLESGIIPVTNPFGGHRMSYDSIWSVVKVNFEDGETYVEFEDRGYRWNGEILESRA